MPRRYYYPRRCGGRDKYSIETTAGQITSGEGGDANAIVVPAADIQGMRKVKHITIQMGALGTPSSGNNTVYWGLVYVPEGYNPNTLSISGTGFYEPNQFLMSAGVFDFDSGPLRINSPISRNLNGGDKIMLIIKATAAAYTYQYVVRYAITLQ